MAPALTWHLLTSNEPSPRPSVRRLTSDCIRLDVLLETIWCGAAPRVSGANGRLLTAETMSGVRQMLLPIIDVIVAVPRSVAIDRSALKVTLLWAQLGTAVPGSMLVDLLLTLMPACRFRLNEVQQLCSRRPGTPWVRATAFRPDDPVNMLWVCRATALRPY